jgi:hypothetical protein
MRQNPRAILDAVGRSGVEDEFSRGPRQVPYWGQCDSREPRKVGDDFFYSGP